MELMRFLTFLSINLVSDVAVCEVFPRDFFDFSLAIYSRHLIETRTGLRTDHTFVDSMWGESQSDSNQTWKQIQGASAWASSKLLQRNYIRRRCGSVFLRPYDIDTSPLPGPNPNSSYDHRLSIDSEQQSRLRSTWEYRI